MSSALQAFDFHGRSVRTAGTFDEPLFCAMDVCCVLGIAKVAQACERLEQDEQELVLLEPAEDTKQASTRKHALFVTESGLYKIVLRSNKPEARAFERWITRDVIPAIRRHGSYSLPGTTPTLSHDQLKGLLAEILAPLRAEIEALKSSSGGVIASREHAGLRATIKRVALMRVAASQAPTPRHATGKLYSELRTAIGFTGALVHLPACYLGVARNLLAEKERAAQQAIADDAQRRQERLFA